MNDQNEKPAHMLLFRGNTWYQGLTPEQIQQVTDQWKAWFDGLIQQGKLRSGHPLESRGKLVSGKKGQTIADGPFAESKEAVGGYFFLDVGTMEEAVAIAKQCPGLAYGAVVEVRPVAAMCPAADLARKNEMAMASASA